ncbi:hypothetical protein FACS189434_10330 [Bacteroidia bacterium]|nr:hypothetical protein FACS189434_10330 [Bacteroidia bacterium]
MTTASIQNQFFAPIIPPKVIVSEYDNLDIVIEMCDVLSRVNNQSIYVIDYKQQTFLHVSPHPLFLCGYSADEVKAMGYSFYEKVVSPDELQMLLEINKLGWELFYSIPAKERIYSRISYDFHLYHKNGHRTLVNHKLGVLRLATDGNIWLGICVVNYSPNKMAGNVIFSHSELSQYYVFDVISKKITPHIPKRMTKREEEIFRLIMQGYGETEIGERLYLSVHTIKNHRRNIENKLGVNNLTNAVAKFNLSF